MGLSPAPKWLEAAELLRQFGHDRQAAGERYRRFVLDGEGARIWDKLRQQIYLGNEAFVENMQRRSKSKAMRPASCAHNVALLLDPD